MYVKVNVVAGAKKEAFVEKGDNSFVAQVKEPAERNLANKRVIELISSHYSVSENRVRIINGHHHSSKLFSVEID
jgi:uncharacterized protein YggU (UPF0235/DUF167 family)